MMLQFRVVLPSRHRITCIAKLGDAPVSLVASHSADGTRAKCESARRVPAEKIAVRLTSSRVR